MHNLIYKLIADHGVCKDVKCLKMIRYMFKHSTSFSPERSVHRTRMSEGLEPLQTSVLKAVRRTRTELQTRIRPWSDSNTVRYYMTVFTISSPQFFWGSLLRLENALTKSIPHKYIYFFGIKASLFVLIFCAIGPLH